MPTWPCPESGTRNSQSRRGRRLNVRETALLHDRGSRHSDANGVNSYTACSRKLIEKCRQRYANG